MLASRHMNSMNMTQMYYTVFYFATIFLVCLGNENDSGPFDYSVTDLRSCNDTGTNEIQLNLVTERRLQRYGERPRFCFSGNITFNRQFDDNMQKYITIRANQNGTYNKTVMQFHLKRACTDLKSFESNWFKMMEAIGVNIKDCPIKKGSYSVNCTDSPTVAPESVQQFTYGLYRTTVELRDQQTRVGCIQVDTTIYPKKTPHQIYQ